MIQLTVCVIGKNQADSLLRLNKSIERLRKAPYSVETLYIDSASNDASCEVAKQCFDRVLTLEASPHLCASAGRYVGTAAARGDWVLYLDGDMELLPSFADFIIATCDHPAEKTGWVGWRIDRFYDGRQLDKGRHPGQDRTKANHFGGAVLLPRLLVLNSGSWDPSVFSMEEGELHARLRAAGGKVLYRDECMLLHHTPHIPLFQKVYGFFFPFGYLGKKFYGPGQVLAAGVTKGSLWDFIKFYPYPFLWSFFLLSGAITAIFGFVIPALVLWFTGALYLGLTQGLRFCILHSASIVSGLLGYRKYMPGFSPKVISIQD